MVENPSVSNEHLIIIRRAIEEARRTDYIMPTWLPFIPSTLAVFALELLLLGAMLNPTALVGITIMTLITLVISIPLGIYVLYKLISRRNNHFKRVHKLYKNIIALLDSLGMKGPEIADIRWWVQEMEYEESPRYTGLWIILTLVTGLATFYVYHFLNKDFYNHERREERIFKDLQSIFEKEGIPVGNLDISVIPNRNTILYIILTVITGGLFGLYWIYTLVRDPNNHFIEHRRIEEKLLQGLEQLIKVKTNT